jgi:hypothetical protein
MYFDFLGWRRPNTKWRSGNDGVNPACPPGIAHDEWVVLSREQRGKLWRDGSTGLRGLQKEKYTKISGRHKKKVKLPQSNQPTGTPPEVVRSEFGGHFETGESSASGGHNLPRPTGAVPLVIPHDDELTEITNHMNELLEAFEEAALLERPREDQQFSLSAEVEPEEDKDEDLPWREDVCSPCLPILRTSNQAKTNHEEVVSSSGGNQVCNA